MRQEVEILDLLVQPLKPLQWLVSKKVYPSIIFKNQSEVYLISGKAGFLLFSGSLSDGFHGWILSHGKRGVTLRPIYVS